ncbi:hypothetical protein BDV97DRAFT_402741 [Delphinella strobiligena]|nr:hypothetical protein BDV97DRAFT_402741 [Delphinella strobiligena]
MEQSSPPSSDSDSDWDEQGSDGQPQPLAFLSIDPFPNLGHNISGHPVAIVDSSKFDEDTEKDSLTPAHAVATALWNWHPNALRAFLDTSIFKGIEWVIRDRTTSTRTFTHLIARHDREVVVGCYNYDLDWELQCSFGMPENSPWGRYWARDTLYNERWKAASKRTHTLTLGDSSRPVDPHTLFGTKNDAVCTSCDASALTRRLRHCAKCHSARYCSTECQASDWKVHNAICKAQIG